MSPNGWVAAQAYQGVDAIEQEAAAELQQKLHKADEELQVARYRVSLETPAAGFVRRVRHHHRALVSWTDGNEIGYQEIVKEVDARGLGREAVLLRVESAFDKPEA